MFEGLLLRQTIFLLNVLATLMLFRRKTVDEVVCGHQKRLCNTPCLSVAQEGEGLQ
jgi:hypothetical protein